MTDNKYIASAKEKREMRLAWEGLNEATRASYDRLAAHFYSERMNGEALTPKRIADALKGAAGDYRPEYWRRLRNALMYDQATRGYHDAALRLKDTKNPSTTGPKADRTGVKAKQRRVKTVADADLVKIFKAADAKEDYELCAALGIAKGTGCRPAEMIGIEDRGNGQLFIPGAKKSKGERGLDRVITLKAEDYENIIASVQILKNADPGKSGTMHKIQSRLDRLTKKLWPRRKTHPTLYSFRHQMGADLKSSGMTRKEIAYCMGHQSTESVEVYGDRRKGKGRSAVKPAPGADLSQIRVNHAAPGPKAPAISSPGLGIGL